MSTPREDLEQKHANSPNPTAEGGELPTSRRQAAERREDESQDQYNKRIRNNELARKRRAEKKATSQAHGTTLSQVISLSSDDEFPNKPSHRTISATSEDWEQQINTNLPTSTKRQAAARREGETEIEYNKRMRRNEAARKKWAENKIEGLSQGQPQAHRDGAASTAQEEHEENDILLATTQQRSDETDEQFAKRLRHNEVARQSNANKKDLRRQIATATNSLSIEVVHGDITCQGIQMVINAAHEQLIPGGGIDGAIRKVEGQVFNALTAKLFHDYCTRQNRTTLNYGDYLTAPANAIAGAKYVTHVVGPRLAYGAAPSAGDRFKMIRTYQAAFSATENSGCQEVVIPFIGSGIFHYPMDQSQYLALYTILRRLPKLKRIVFCHTDAPVVAAFAQLMGGKQALRVDSQAHADALATQLLRIVTSRTGMTAPSAISNGALSIDLATDTNAQNVTGDRIIKNVPLTAEEIRRRNLAIQNEKALRRTDEERSEFNSTRNTRRRVKASTLNKVSSNVIPDELKDYSKIENSAPRQLHLQDPSKCNDCGAITYTPNCCQKGSVCIPPPVDQPKEIKELLTGSDPDSAHFRQARSQHVPIIYGRFQEAVAYNSSFAMGSLSYNREKTTKGPPFAKVNGMFHHLMGALETPEGKTPLFQQIYKYDVDEAARYRKMNPITGPILQPKIVKKLTKLFTEKNFLAKQFKTVDQILGEMKAKKIKARNFCLVLRSPTEAEFHGADHPGTLERPRKELESFLYQELDDGGPPKYGVWVVQKKGGSKLSCLGYFNPLIDPVCYPLIFPYGQSGFKYGEYKRDDPNLHAMPTHRQKEETDEEEDDFDCQEDERNAPENQRSLFADSDEEQGDGAMDDLQEGMQGIEVSAQETVNAMDTDEWNAEDDRGNGNTENTADDDEELRDEDILETELQSDDPPDVNLLRHPEDERPIMEEDEDIDLEQTDVHYSPTGKNRKRQFVSRREFLLHQMQMRDPQFHPVLSTLLLGQLYVIDQALRVIRQRNDNMRKHCVELRGATAQSLNFLNQSRRAQQKGYNLGYVFRVSRKATGSAGWYRERFENAMAVIDKIGKPDLFITMTGDPNWPEIKDNLLPNTNWQSNPFLVNDVFYTKMQELIDDVVEKELFGPVMSFCFSVEFQKRGMPHMHMLLTLAASLQFSTTYSIEGSKLSTPEDIDKHIWARIPPKPEEGEENYEEKLRFHNNVVDKMVHTPCQGRPDAYCNQRPANARKCSYTKCTKCFPNEFAEFTSLRDGGKFPVSLTRELFGLVNGLPKSGWCAGLV